MFTELHFFIGQYFVSLPRSGLNAIRSAVYLFMSLENLRARPLQKERTAGDTA